MREFQKGISEMKQISRIKECFHPKKENCVMPIKQAHSLQRNGRLSLVEELVNGQNCLYTITSFTSTTKSHIAEFTPVGKKLASTFYGFCQKHDSEVFSPIENFEFNGSNEHLFLHTYRSFAHTYHRKKEELKLYKSEWKIMKLMEPFIRNQMIKGAELGLRDLELEKDYLDKLLLEKKYDQLEYFLFETNAFYPFGCSSAIAPHFTVKNEPLESDINNSDKPWVPLILTVVPDKINSFIILAANPKNPSAIKFLDHLEELNDTKCTLAISTLMTMFAENTFWSPKLHDSLSPNSKNILKRNASYIFDESKHKKFPWSSLNLFQERFEAKNLGITK